MFGGTSNYRTGNINHATLPIEKEAVATSLLCERERGLNKLAHNLTTQLYKYENCNLLVDNKLTNLIYDGVEPLIGNRPRWKVPQPPI